MNRAGKTGARYVDVGQDDEGVPIRMVRSEKTFQWLTEKYGSDIRPWEYRVTLDNKDWQNTVASGQNKIYYAYSLKNDFAIEALK